MRSAFKLLPARYAWTWTDVVNLVVGFLIGFTISLPIFVTIYNFGVRWVFPGMRAVHVPWLP